MSPHVTYEWMENKELETRELQLYMDVDDKEDGKKIYENIATKPKLLFCDRKISPPPG